MLLTWMGCYEKPWVPQETKKGKGTSQCDSSGLVALMVVYTAGCLKTFS